jgi:hypothetical protein
MAGVKCQCRDLARLSAVTLRLRGNPDNPNHAAVSHLLANYALHLGTRLEHVWEDSGEADIWWDCSPPRDARACLVFPGRSGAEPRMECGRTREGFPVPVQGVALAGVALASAGGQVLDAAGGFRMLGGGPDGSTVFCEWDLLSFCADILFRRADFLPSRIDAARAGLGRGQWDEAFGLLEEPWVDHWMFRLLGYLPRFRAAIESLPGRARVWLTHDLDNLAKWRLRSVAGQILRTPMQLARGQRGAAARAWGEIAVRALTGRDPYDVMDKVFAMESGRRSANFFLATGRDHVLHRYDLERPRFLKVLKACQKRGMDVGLHGQVHFCADAAGMRAETEKLARLSGRPVGMNRQHYLRWDPAKTLPGLEAAGVRVDSTLGYNDSPGFRAGTAWPYLWFDCALNRATRILEVPLILGEFQFYNPRDFDPEAVHRVIERYLAAACRQGGVFTVLFHNDYFHEGDCPGNGAVYAGLLRRIKGLGLPDFDPLEAQARYAGTHAGN